MGHFSRQLAWQNFFAVQVAEAEIEEAEAEAELRYREAAALLESGKKLNEARASRDIDPGVVSAREAHAVAHARRKLLQVTTENRERCANLLSRELTRRVGREGNYRRNDRWNP